MTAKIVTDYLSKRAAGERGLRAPKFKFTLAQLKSLPTADFDYEVRDTEQKGFICRVRSSGVKSLEIYKKPKGSHKPARISICQLGAMKWKAPGDTKERNVEDEVFRILDLLRQGKDPNKEAKIEKLAKDNARILLAVAATRYIDAMSKQGPEGQRRKRTIKHSTKIGYEAIIDNHFESVKNENLADILVSDRLQNLHEEIGNKKGPVAANNAMRLLRAIAKYTRTKTTTGRNESPIPIWPITEYDVFWNQEKRRTGWIKPEYLKAWWNATERLPAEYLGDGETARDYLQFVLLSGLRRREATRLDWQDIDFKTKSFKIPDTKNGTVLELPCSDHMVKILKRRKEHGGAGPFKIDEPKKFVAWVRKESGVHFTIHDLRRSFITYAESLDFGQYTIKALVNHSTGNSRDVTEGYLQLSTERLRRPMQKLSTYVLTCIKDATQISFPPGTKGSLE